MSVNKGNIITLTTKHIYFAQVLFIKQKTRVNICFEIVVGNIHYNTEDLCRILIERQETEKLKLQFGGKLSQSLWFFNGV